MDARFLRLLLINPCHLIKIAAGTFLKMTDAQRDLSRCEVAIPVVHRFESIAVNGYASTAQNTDAAAEVNKARTSLADG